MVRHGSFLAPFAAVLFVVSCLVACAPDPQKKPTSMMNIQTAGKGGAAGANGAAGTPATPSGAAGDGASAGAMGLAGDGGGAAGTGAAGDPGAAGTGAAGSAGSGSAGAAGAAGSTGAADGGAAGTTGAAGAKPPDASADAADGRAAEVAPPPPPVNGCARTTWKFTPSIVCTTVCAGMAISQKDPANAIDGNADTRYTTGTFQGSQGTETATLTFPAPITITGITLVSRGGDGPQLYRVDWSTDGTTFWTFEPAVTGLGSDNMTVPFPAPKKVLGVRVTQLGLKPTNWWSVHEIGVTGCMP